MSFIPAVGALGSIGFCFGIGLAAAYRFLAVEVDLVEAQLVEILPGINCGACGFPGCSGYAAGLAAGEAEPGKCLPGGKDVAVAVGRVLGIDVVVGVKKVPGVMCKGGGLRSSKKFLYEGVNDCQMAVLVGDGDKLCRYACLGLGTCVRACDFDAIAIHPESGLPVINREKCVSCGNCARECPKSLIELNDIGKLVQILCSSNEEKGITVKKACQYGCIKCRKCIKVCQVDAPHFVNNIIRIDLEKCTKCGDCVKAS